MSYYIGEKAQLAPTGTSIVNLDDVPTPDLAIEIADTSLSDDIGEKRLLYEELNVGEYWADYSISGFTRIRNSFITGNFSS